MRALVVAFVLAAGCGRDAGTTAEAIDERPYDPETLFSAAPAGTTAVLAIDLDRVRGSRAARAIVERAGLGEHLAATQPTLAVAIAPGPIAVLATSPSPRIAFAGAIHVTDAQRALAGSALPGLAGIRAVTGTLDITRGATLAATAVFPDAQAAAKVAVDIAMARKLVATQLPAPAATAFDKLAITAIGSTIRITAWWTEADVLALVDATR